MQPHKRTPHVFAGLLFFLAFASCLIAGSSGCRSPDKPQAPKEMFAILPLTGPSADLGRSVDQGMRLAIEDLRSTNKPYLLRVEDSQGNAEKALTAYRSVDAGRFGHVVLSWMSSAGRALAPVTRQEGSLLFVGAALSDLTTPDAKVVRVWANANQIGEAMGNFALAQGFSRVAIIHVNDDYGRSVSSSFSQVVKRSGGQIVAAEAVDSTQAEYRTVAFKVKQEKPQALFFPAYGGAYSNGLRQIREILGESFPIMADFTLLSSFTLPKVGAAAEGVYVPATVLDLDPRPTDAARSFAKRYEDKFRMQADFNSGLGYMMVTIAATALESRGTPASLPDAVRGRTFSGPVGTLVYDRSNDCKLEIQIAQIRDGRARSIASSSK